MRVELNVSLDSIQELQRVKDIFSSINENNNMLTRVLLDNSNNSLADAQRYAIKVGEEAKNSLSQKIAFGFLLSAIIVCVVIAFFIRTMIIQPIHQTVEVIQDLEKGHIGKRLHLDRKDEIGVLANSMNSLGNSLQEEVVGSLEKLALGDLTYQINPNDALDVLRGDLNDLMSQIHAGADQMTAGASQVTDNSQSLSQGATEQASSLQEIASSMDRLGEQTKTNAENANLANQLTAASQKAAERGNKQMQEMIEAMAEINQSSQNISKINKVIDEIAFQTNLLALNAAVEAARAGKHGKGFAVVAEEVRNLAARSAHAAKEIAALIEGSSGKTKRGSDIADQTAMSLGEIVKSINQVTELVTKIAAASNEQAQGIAHVNQGVSQIDNVAQQTTAHAEESAAAAEQLSAQANQLRAMLSRFSLQAKYHTMTEGGAEKQDQIKLSAENHKYIENKNHLVDDR